MRIVQTNTDDFPGASVAWVVALEPEEAKNLPPDRIHRVLGAALYSAPMEIYERIQQDLVRILGLVSLNILLSSDEGSIEEVRRVIDV